MHGKKVGKGRSRKHGSQSFRKDRRGRRCIRYLRIPRPAGCRKYSRGKGSVDRHNSNRRARLHFLASLQMEEKAR